MSQVLRGWRCGGCRSLNDREASACENCGNARPVRVTAPGTPARRVEAPAHICQPDHDTGLCQCGKVYSSSDVGRRLMRAILDVATGKIKESEVAALIDESFAGAVKG